MYLMHSQLIVPSDSLWLAKQKEQQLAEAQKRKGGHEECLRMLTLPLNFPHHENGKFQGRTSTNHPTTVQQFTLFCLSQSCRLQVQGIQIAEISQFYRQIGNAVSPPCVATDFGRQLGEREAACD